MTFHEKQTILNKKGKQVAKIHYKSSIKSSLKNTLREPLFEKEHIILEQEARKYRTADEFIKAQAVKAQLQEDGTKINPDGTVTLYHATSPEIIAKIEREGFIKGGSTATGGMTGLALQPSAFFGTDKNWTRDIWGHSGEIIEIRVPAEYIRKPAQNLYEVYFEGGLKRREDGIWIPAQPPRSTFYDILAEKHLVDRPKLIDIWKKASSHSMKRK